MIKPKKVNGLDVTFGSTSNLPKLVDIPESFRKGWCTEHWCKIAEDWFFGKLEKLPIVKKELDENEVYRALRSILVSFEPSHEHKIAGVGFLLSQWCERDLCNGSA